MIVGVKPVPFLAFASSLDMRIGVLLSIGLVLACVILVSFQLSTPGPAMRSRRGMPILGAVLVEDIFIALGQADVEIVAARRTS